jgi:hypothetical protein
MAEPSMNPDELAWAYQNAGRAPAAQKTTSEAFAAQARDQELQALQRKARIEQQQQDLQFNRTIHAQDMAAASAHHNALMGEYSLVQQVKNAFADTGRSGFRTGFFWGMVAGAVIVGVLSSKGR